MENDDAVCAHFVHRALKTRASGISRRSVLEQLLRYSRPKVEHLSQIINSGTFSFDEHRNAQGPRGS